MTQFIHWRKIDTFPFDEIMESFEVDVKLGEAWEDVKRIMKEHGFAMQEHFGGSFVAFPFGETAEQATEAWEGWEV